VATIKYTQSTDALIRAWAFIVRISHLKRPSLPHPALQGHMCVPASSSNIIHRFQASRSLKMKMNDSGPARRARFVPQSSESSEFLYSTWWGMGNFIFLYYESNSARY
jgi:hypothetical protein